MTDDGKVTCPQARRTKTRRKNLKKKWTGKVWKEKREGFIKSRGGKCEWCGIKQGVYLGKDEKGRDRYLALTVHHPMRDSYGDMAYMDFYLSGCIVLCPSCHYATHHSRTLCERHHDDGENHYRWHDAEMCGYCFLKEHPEISGNRKLERKAAKHPCKLHGIGGICGASMINTRCRFSPSKALAQCGDSVAKKVTA